MGETGPSANPFDPPKAAIERPNTRPAGEMGPLARFFGVYTAPAKTFASIARWPGKDWLFPLGVVVVLALIFGVLAGQRVDVDQEIERAMQRIEERTDLPEAQRAQIEETQRTMMGATTKALPLFSAFAVLVMVFVVSGLWHGIAAAFGKKTTFSRTLTGYAYVQAIGILKLLVSLPVLLSKKTIELENMGAILKSNLGAFVSDEGSPVLRAFATTIDVFDIWGLIVAVIAVKHVTKFKTGGAVALVLTLWLLYVCFVVGSAAIGAAFSGG